jgi:hypothetical protein
MDSICIIAAISLTGNGRTMKLAEKDSTRMEKLEESQEHVMKMVNK